MRTIFVLLVAMLVAPAFGARVDVECTCPPDSCEVTVQYINTEPNHVRAFALDIILDNPDANIVSVHGYDPVYDDYYIYPGSIDVNTDTNNIDNYGSFVASKAKYPDGTRPGLDSNAMTIEMASLYWPTGGSSPNAPADSNILFKFYVTADTNIIIQLNTKRGGIVMEDGNSPSDVNLSTCRAEFQDCFPSDHPDFSTWVSVGKPDCWCYPRQCHGDADGAQEGDEKQGYFWVSNADLQVLVDGWMHQYSGSPTQDGTDPGSDPDYWICADFERHEEGDEKQGYFRVSNEDLQVLVDYWMDKVTVEPNCITIY